MDDIKITKREILFSVIIIALMLVIGIVIHGKISDNLMEKHQKYYTALQIQEDEDLFSYGMRTDIGNAFVYGDLKAVDTVSYEDIKGEYSYIKKVKERYTMHTRTVTYTTGSGKSRQTHTRVETYWTWDYVDSESKHCNEISFLNTTFPYGTIPFPSEKYIDTVYKGGNIRYVYYGIGTKYTGTIYTQLGNDTISNTEFYNDKNIESTIEIMTSNFPLVIFWIVWIIVIAGCVFMFYIFDNKWLENKRS